MKKSLISPFSLTSYVLLALLTYFLTEDAFRFNGLSIDPSLRLAVSLLLAFVPFLILDAIMYAFHNHQGVLSEKDGLPINTQITYKHAFQEPEITTLSNGNIHIDFGNGYATFSAISSSYQNVECFGSLAFSIRNNNTNSLVYVGNWKNDN